MTSFLKERYAPCICRNHTIYFVVAVFKSLHEIMKASVLCDSKKKCSHLQVFLKFNKEI